MKKCATPEQEVVYERHIQTGLDLPTTAYSIDHYSISLKGQEGKPEHRHKLTVQIVLIVPVYVRSTHEAKTMIMNSQVADSLSPFSISMYACHFHTPRKLHPMMRRPISTSFLQIVLASSPLCRSFSFLQSVLPVRKESTAHLMEH